MIYNRFLCTISEGRGAKILNLRGIIDSRTLCLKGAILKYLFTMHNLQFIMRIYLNIPRLRGEVQKFSIYDL